MVAPEPAHHVREDRAPLLLAVQPDSPGVGHVVARVRERLHQPYVLQEPVAPFVVLAVASDAAVIVAAVLQVNPNRLLRVVPNEIGVGISAAQVREAANDAENFSELVRPLPGYSERRDRS